MPLFDSVVVQSGRRVSRFLRKGFKVAVGVSTILASSMAFAGETENPPAKVDLSAIMEASKLRTEARLAAEQGDFAKAADNLEMAALKVGDRQMTKRVRDAKEQLQAGGGSQANFGPLMQLIQSVIAPDSWVGAGGDEIGSMTPFDQGVFLGIPSIANALIRSNHISRLNTAAELAASANHNENVREASALRLVSLPRLEQHVKALKAAGKPVSEDVACLAGLTEVRFLFVFPQTSDIVIGGPAGDWTTDEAGRKVGVADHRPTLQLDDLVTLSRTFSSGGSGFFRCSIDPKAEQVKAVREYAQQNQVTPQNVRKFTKHVEETLGLQNVIVQGIPEDSRVAKVIVDADYQMKLIGIGQREGLKGMKSYFELVTKAERKGASMDALRWWMTVGYDSIQVAPNQQAFEFTGREVQCQSENQLLQADGSRQATGKADGANSEFARLFTEHLPELAAEDVVFADLQNVFDLGLATALVHSMGLNRQIGWQSDVFAVDGDYSTASVDVPDELMTAANSRIYRGTEIMIQVAGGVRGDLRSVVKNPENFEVSAEVVGKATNANPIGQTGRWWWDAAAR